MRLCFDHRFALRFAGLAITIAGMASAAAVQRTETPRVRSVVRADARGRLVRTVVVSAPRVAVPDAGSAASASQTASVTEMVEAAAKQYNVDPLLVHSVIQTESNYNQYAVSPKGAQGLMQLMPATARRFGVQNSFDIKQNIEGGVRYLKYLGTLFPNDPRLAIAAYNAGEGAVWKYGNTVPPYRETEQYVQRVGSRYGKARKAAEQKKESAPVEIAQAGAKPAEAPKSPIYVYIDAEGRLYLRNVPADGHSLEQTP